MDVLADVLANLRLQGRMYFRTEFAGTWGVALPADRNAVRFHLVMHGQCWLTVVHNAPLPLREGDFALVPHGAAQALSGSAGADTVSLASLLRAGALGDDRVLRHGSGDAARRTRLVCGFCSFDEGFRHPLLLGLPAVLVMRRNLSGSSPWLAEAVRVIIMEAELDGIGGSAVIDRLIEVLFIQAIRHQRAAAPDQEIPFLAAIADNKLRPAIEAIHEHPEQEWTLGRLAGLTSMSRGRFAQRFKDVLGQSPMHYVAGWRLQRARRLLQETDLSVAEIGYRCGYRSLPSFTRRFGKQFGISPAAFRKQR